MLRIFTNFTWPPSQAKFVPVLGTNCEIFSALVEQSNAGQTIFTVFLYSFSGGFKTTIQVLFCATCTILHNKNRSSALFSSIKFTFYLRIFLKRIEKTHLKSPVFTKCLLVWLNMESVGNVGVWCVPSNPLRALPKECRWKTKTV